MTGSCFVCTRQIGFPNQPTHTAICNPCMQIIQPHNYHDFDHRKRAYSSYYWNPERALSLA